MRPHLFLAFALAVTACGGSDKSGDTGNGQLTFTPSLGVDLATMKRTQSGAWYKDLTEGAGTPIVAGQMAAIHYDGHLPSGVRFDQNGPQDQPFTFPLGTGSVVKGFDEGVLGMKQGGRRLVVIPPELGYGAQGSPPVVPPNATLVFTIDLVAIR